MKGLYIGLVTLFIILSLAACSSETSSNSRSTYTGKLLSGKQFSNMLNSPEEYEGAKVEFCAKGFSFYRKEGNGAYYTALAGNNINRDVILYLENYDQDINANEIIFVKGKLKGVFEVNGKELDGIAYPIVAVKELGISDYQTAFAPAKKTVEVNQEIDQQGFLIKLSKIELAENETRLFVSITNNSSSTVRFISHTAKLVSGTKQLTVQHNEQANYPSVYAETRPGAQTEGMVVFPKIPSSGKFSVSFEGRTDNFEIQYQPFQFEVQY